MAEPYIDTIGRWGKGNIDLNNRVVIYNIDGSISTERSFSVGIDDKEVLLPTIINGVIVSEDEAIDHFYETNEYLGKFDTIEEAEEYAEKLHERQEWYYTKRVKKQFYFKIDGVDIAPIIKYKGIKWTRNDIDSANAGRDLSGKMNRGRVTSKIKIEITCLPLNQEKAQALLNLIDPEYVLVDYYDPKLGERTGVEFYSNNVPATFGIVKSDGSFEWDDISFPLVER